MSKQNNEKPMSQDEKINELEIMEKELAEDFKRQNYSIEFLENKLIEEKNIMEDLKFRVDTFPLINKLLETNQDFQKIHHLFTSSEAHRLSHALTSGIAYRQEDKIDFAGQQSAIFYWNRFIRTAGPMAETSYESLQKKKVIIKAIESQIEKSKNK